MPRRTRARKPGSLVAIPRGPVRPLPYPGNRWPIAAYRQDTILRWLAERENDILGEPGIPAWQLRHGRKTDIRLRSDWYELRKYGLLTVIARPFFRRSKGLAPTYWYLLSDLGRQYLRDVTPDEAARRRSAWSHGGGS